MIHSKTAFTYEIDDREVAVSEIREQLTSLPPARNRIGIVTCSYDYAESGIIGALSDAFDFPILGMTTISQAVPHEAGLLMLTLMVLSSDDCQFSPSLTDRLTDGGNLRSLFGKAYREAAEKLDEKEKLILLFAPIINSQSGDGYVNALSELSNGTPIFGSICADDQSDTYENAHTLYGSAAYKDCAAFILISGEFEPEFRMASISNESRLSYKGEITASDDNILMGVNDMSVASYLETIGLASGGKIRSGINSIPFLINEDGMAGDDREAVARVLFLITPDNHAVCGGAMPVGASITAGLCDKNDVLLTTRKTIEDIANTYQGRPVLMFSCLGRRLALGTDPLSEVQLAVDEMPPHLDFMLSYSGGEICPVKLTPQKNVNRFHNYTFVACIL